MADGSFSVEDGYVIGTYTDEGRLIDIKVNGASARADLDSVTIKFSPAEEENTVEVFVDGALAHTYTVTAGGAEEVEAEVTQSYANEYVSFGVEVSEPDDSAPAQDAAPEAVAGEPAADAGEQGNAPAAEDVIGAVAEPEETAAAAAEAVEAPAASGSTGRSMPKMGYLIGGGACIAVIIVVVAILLFGGRKKSKH